MGRHNDLGDRLDLALGTSGPPRPFDRTITRAMHERRRRFLDQKDGPIPESDTAVIQARLAAARAKPQPDET